METSIDIVKRVQGMTEAQLRAVHAATGIPEPTLAKIRYGITSDPRGSTIDKLRGYFAQAQEA